MFSRRADEHRLGKLELIVLFPRLLRGERPGGGQNAAKAGESQEHGKID